VLVTLSPRHIRKGDSFNRVVRAFPELKGHLTRLYWVEGERIGRARYLPKRNREEVLGDLKRAVEKCGITYATCREGLSKLQSAATCDGAHLIPARRRSSRLL